MKLFLRFILVTVFLLAVQKNGVNQELNPDSIDIYIQDQQKK